MKKITLISVLAVWLMAQETYSTYFIKDAGKKVEIKAKDKNESSKLKKVTKDGKKFDANTKIIVKFTNNTDVDEFCSKYNLEISHKMVTGHYILKNNSKLQPMELIKKVLKDDEDKIISIFPNWQLNKKKQ